MLRSGDNAFISKQIAQMQDEARMIIRNIVELVWYMRGGIQYDSMMLMTPGERQIVSDFIEKRMESVSKMSFPVY